MYYILKNIEVFSHLTHYLVGDVKWIFYLNCLAFDKVLVQVHYVDKYEFLYLCSVHPGK